ncbi:MAG TPA: hypothetical protein VF460_06950, partial [Burkholderiales bacterium]
MVEDDVHLISDQFVEKREKRKGKRGKGERLGRSCSLSFLFPLLPFLFSLNREALAGDGYPAIRDDGLSRHESGGFR